MRMFARTVNIRGSQVTVTIFKSENVTDENFERNSLIIRSNLGNTRVVGQEQLQKFQESLGKALHDPFQVVMRQTKLPISLLAEKAKVPVIACFLYILKK